MRVLNVLDARLQGLLRCRGSDWLISLESTVAEDPTPMDEERMDGCNLESSKSHIVQILQFTSSLLQRSVGKDVYNSAEVRRPHCSSFSRYRELCFFSLLPEFTPFSNLDIFLVCTLSFLGRTVIHYFPFPFRSGMTWKIRF